MPSIDGPRVMPPGSATLVWADTNPAVASSAAEMTQRSMRNGMVALDVRKE